MTKKKELATAVAEPAADATPEVLHAYWREKALEYGLRDTTADKMQTAELMEYAQQIAAALGVGGEEIDVAIAATEAASDEVKNQRAEFQSIRGDLYKDGTRRIMIAADRDNQEEDVQFFGINGYPFYIKRGHEVTVPLALIEVLENAVIKDGKMKIGSSHERPEMIFKQIPRFSWNYVDDGRRRA
jgi:hypothetical protein